MTLRRNSRMESVFYTKIVRPKKKGAKCFKKTGKEWMF